MKNTSESTKQLLRDLRLAEIQAKKELWHYKFLYSQESRENKTLQKKLKEINKNYKILQTKYDELCSKLSDMCPYDDKSRCKRKRKSWTNVKCDRTKRQRWNDYGKVMFKTLSKNVPQCKRAHLSLSLGNKTVNYMWKCSQFKDETDTLSSISVENFKANLDHSYASSKLVNADMHEDEFEDIDYGSTLDSEGNWQKKHKRSIISVMDSYRISHEAYHELRHTGKGHFPPFTEFVRRKFPCP